MSTGANPRKVRCKPPKSRLRVESRAILSLRLRVWVDGRCGDRCEPSCGHAPWNSQVQVRGALGGDLREDARGRRPLLARVLAGSEHQFGSVMERCDHAAVVDRQL